MLKIPKKGYKYPSVIKLYLLNIRPEFYTFFFLQNP